MRSPSSSDSPDSAPKPRAWAPSSDQPTVLVIVRHGETEHTQQRRFSGGLASANPGLNQAGRDQVRTTALWLADWLGPVDALVASPVRRTWESAQILAEVLGHRPVAVPGLAEMEFGRWDGLTFAEVQERHPEELADWLGSLDHPAGGGESFQQVQQRVLAAQEELIATYPGKLVLACSHVTPIKTLVAHALDAPLEAVFRMELAPATVTSIAYYALPDHDTPRPSLRLFNASPGSTPA